MKKGGRKNGIRRKKIMVGKPVEIGMFSARTQKSLMKEPIGYVQKDCLIDVVHHKDELLLKFFFDL